MLKKAALFLAFGAACFATPTVATVTSPEPIALDGHALSGVVISSWPLVTGDSVATTSSPATLSFKDGSSVQLSKNSSANLVGSSDQPKLVLTSGSLDYKIVPGSKLIVARSTDLVKAVTPASISNIASTRSSHSSFFAASAAYASVAGVSAAAVALTSGSSGASQAATSTVGSLSATPVSSLAAGPVAHNSVAQLSCPVNVLGFVLLYDPFIPAKFGGPAITCWDPVFGPFYQHLWWIPSYVP
jgi:hypothetical protein